MKLTHIPSV